MPEASDRPTGTVTFLFTDIEGSTGLWEHDGAAMSAALVRHDELLHDAIERHAGQVFATGGDGFAAVFASASGALAAAIDAQRALGGEDWPAGAPVRVRMGLHAGEADERGRDYFGPPVNLAARLMGTAHGGQIVCTATVADMVWGDDLELVDLGEHRLRDIESTVRVAQVCVPGAPREFPPLRSLRQRRTNLPEDVSSFIGRRDERAEVAGFVREARLVTVTGSGGVGKTRLARRVAGDVAPEFVDGVWFCDLAPVDDAGGIDEVIAAALHLAPPQGVTVAAAIEEFLGPRTLLLVLDNCEHVIGEVAELVARTLAGAGGVRILATSREPVGLIGEVVVHLASLSVPTGPSADAILGSESGTLFVDRARAVRPAFDLDASAADVAELCSRLDGIPLAIELAAARVASIDPSEIVRRLGHRFELLGGARAADMGRHRTLRAAVGWSYDLLDERERATLQQLSTAVGGFDLAAAIAMAEVPGVDEFEALDVLGSLVAKSLVERSETDLGRYRMLETIREYVLERLAEDGLEPLARDRHARHHLAAWRDQLEALGTPGDYDAVERMVPEVGNVLAAGLWTLEHGDPAEVLSHFTVVPPTLLILLPTGVTDVLSRLVDAAFGSKEVLRQPDAGAACWFAVTQAFMDGDLEGIQRWADVSDLVPPGASAALCRTNLASVRGDMEGGAAIVAAVLAERGDELPPLGRAHALGSLALFELGIDPLRALGHADEAVQTCRVHGGPLSLLFPLLVRTAAVAMTDPDQALAAAEEVGRLDRTSRRVNANLAVHLASGRTGLDPDNRVEHLQVMRAALTDLASSGGRGTVVYAVASVAEAVAPADATAALRLACTAEALAGAPGQILDNPAYEALHAAVASVGDPAVRAVRDATSGLTSDEALGAILVQIDELILDASEAQ